MILEDKNKHGVLQDLTKNIEWDVYDMPLYAHNVTYACCPDDFYPVLGKFDVFSRLKWLFTISYII